MNTADLLLALAKAESDPIAWANLVERQGTRLWAVCRTAAGPTLADDAFHDALIRIRQRARTFHPGQEPESSAVAWMVTLAHNAAIDLVRREHRRHQRERKAMPMTVVTESTSATELAEQTQQAMLALAELPERHRQVIRLRLLAGLDAEQTAAELGCPTEQVRVRLHRALALLRGRLALPGAAMLPIATLEDGLRRAATPPTVLPVSAQSVSTAAFQATLPAAGWFSMGWAVAIGVVSVVVLPLIVLGVLQVRAQPSSEDVQKMGMALAELVNSRIEYFRSLAKGQDREQHRLQEELQSIKRQTEGIILALVIDDVATPGLSRQGFGEDTGTAIRKRIECPPLAAKGVDIFSGTRMTQNLKRGVDIMRFKIACGPQSHQVRTVRLDVLCSAIDAEHIKRIEDIARSFSMSGSERPMRGESGSSADF